VNYDGSRIKDDSFYIIFNAHDEALDYMLPSEKCESGWRKVIDTSNGFVGEDTEEFASGSSVKVQSKSVLVLQCKLN